MGKITEYLSENVANRMYGVTDVQKYNGAGVAFDQSAHTHTLKLDAMNGVTTVGGPDSHAHIIISGVIKPASNHTHKIEKLYNTKEEFYNDLSDSNPLKMYGKFNVH